MYLCYQFGCDVYGFQDFQYYFVGWQEIDEVVYQYGGIDIDEVVQIVDYVGQFQL